MAALRAAGGAARAARAAAAGSAGRGESPVGGEGRNIWRNAHLHPREAS